MRCKTFDMTFGSLELVRLQLLICIVAAAGLCAVRRHRDTEASSGAAGHSTDRDRHVAFITRWSRRLTSGKHAASATCPVATALELCAATEGRPVEPALEMSAATEGRPVEPALEMSAATEGRPVAPALEMSAATEGRPVAPALEMSAAMEGRPVAPALEMSAAMECRAAARVFRGDSTEAVRRATAAPWVLRRAQGRNCVTGQASDARKVGIV